MRRVARILHKILMAYFLIAMLPALLLLGLARPNLPGAGPAWLVSISVAVGVPWFLCLAYFLWPFA